MTTTAPTPELRPNRRRRTIVFVAAAAAIVIALTGVFFPRGQPRRTRLGVRRRGGEGCRGQPAAVARRTGLEGRPGRRVHRRRRRADLRQRGQDGSTCTGGRRRSTRRTSRTACTSDTQQPIKLLGQNGTLFRYGTSPDYTTILPPKGPNYLEIRTDLGSEAAYRELVGKLKPVGVEEWLDAMPASAVKPDREQAGRRRDARGAAAPAGFDKTPLYRQTVERPVPGRGRRHRRDQLRLAGPVDGGEEGGRHREGRRSRRRDEDQPQLEDAAGDGQARRLPGERSGSTPTPSPRTKSPRNTSKASAADPCRLARRRTGQPRARISIMKALAVAMLAVAAGAGDAGCR